MTYSQDTRADETCPDCGYMDGHNVAECPRVFSGSAKVMPGLSPAAVGRLRRGGLTVHEMKHC